MIEFEFRLWSTTLHADEPCQVAKLASRDASTCTSPVSMYGSELDGETIYLLVCEQCARVLLKDSESFIVVGEKADDDKSVRQKLNETASRSRFKHGRMGTKNL